MSSPCPASFAHLFCARPFQTVFFFCSLLHSVTVPCTADRELTVTEADPWTPGPPHSTSQALGSHSCHTTPSRTLLRGSSLQHPWCELSLLKYMPVPAVYLVEEVDGNYTLYAAVDWLSCVGLDPQSKPQQRPPALSEPHSCSAVLFPRLSCPFWHSAVEQLWSENVKPSPECIVCELMASPQHRWVPLARVTEVMRGGSLCLSLSCLALLVPCVPCPGQGVSLETSSEISSISTTRQSLESTDRFMG